MVLKTIPDQLVDARQFFFIVVLTYFVFLYLHSSQQKYQLTYPDVFRINND